MHKMFNIYLVRLNFQKTGKRQKNITLKYCYYVLFSE